MTISPVSPISFRADVKTEAKIDAKSGAKDSQAIKTPEKPAAKKAAENDTFSQLGLDDPSPLAIGLGTAVVMFGLSFGLDKLIGKIFKSMKSDNKMSLMINGAFGLIMGGMAYYKARKED